jgi:hypothetical protein
MKTTNHKGENMEKTATFVYGGEVDGKYFGLYINDVAKRRQQAASRNGEWWTHCFPEHRLEADTKADLWAEVKATALQARSTARIAIFTITGEQRMVTVER